VSWIRSIKHVEIVVIYLGSSPPVRLPSWAPKEVDVIQQTQRRVFLKTEVHHVTQYGIVSWRRPDMHCREEKPYEWYVLRVQEPVWTLWRQQRHLLQPGILTPVLQSSSSYPSDFTGWATPAFIAIQSITYVDFTSNNEEVWGLEAYLHAFSIWRYFKRGVSFVTHQFIFSLVWRHCRPVSAIHRPGASNFTYQSVKNACPVTRCHNPEDYSCNLHRRQTSHLCTNSDISFTRVRKPWQCGNLTNSLVWQYSLIALWTPISFRAYRRSCLNLVLYLHILDRLFCL
jgi:hypothetical protein